MTADNCCQSVLVGTTFTHGIGLKNRTSSPLKQKMSAMNRDVIPVLGAVTLRLSGKSGSGIVLETAHLCYVTDVIEGAYLSREVCIALGMSLDRHLQSTRI